MQLITGIISFILHIDAHLIDITSQYGTLTYAILFLIVFAETGFVVTPFLPGDSLLFAAGAISALGSLNVVIVWFILLIAAVLGDTVNYWIGHFFGQKIVDNKHVPISQAHIDQTQAFYAKHGGKTIVLARFVPIVRTFAPFVAGIGRMDYNQFFLYNVVGALLWVTSITFAGYFFGNIPFVRDNFSLVVIAIVVISILPIIYEAIKAKTHAKA